jgi:predicted nuclease of restriction endonuclease-like (RecB) superfamily
MTQIVHSRYLAARLVNREQLLLYFIIGKRLSEKVSSEKWGTKVIEQIAVDLQKELPGLKGFSYRNLRNMRQFADEYSSIAIWQTASARLQSADNQ